MASSAGYSRDIRVWLINATIVAAAFSGLSASRASALADLTPTALTPPASGVAGQSISVTWTVANQGDVSANPSWRDFIWLSTDSTLDGGDVLLSTPTRSAAVVAGNSYSPTTSVGIPNNTAPGSYFLIIQTDADNNVPESNESNQVLAAALTVTKADLTPTNLTPPASGVAGQSISVTFTVANQGDGGANPSWRDFIWLSTNNTLDGSDVLLSTPTHSAALGAGGSYTTTVSVGIPNNTVPGSYFLILQADADNNIPESNEGNQVLAAALTVTKADLTPTNLTPPASGVAGQSISVTFTVANQGDGGANPSWRDFIWLSTNSTLDGSDVLLSTPTHSAALGAGGSYTTTISVGIPNNTVPGSYFLILQADADNNIPESNEGNQVLAAALTVTKADLTPTNLTPPASGVAGQSISVTFTVANQGDGGANPSWRDFIWLSTNNTLDGSDVLLSTPTHSAALGAGSSYTTTVSVGIPNNTVPGSYFLILQADADNNIPESNEGNQTLAAAITINKPDLVPTVLTPPALAAPGESIAVTWTVENQGNGAANPGWRDFIWLSVNGALDGGDVLIATPTHSAVLAAGDSYTSTTSIGIPSNTAPGNYFLIIQTDADSNVPESNEGNQTLAAAITIAVPTSTPTATATATETETATATATATTTITSTATVTATPSNTPTPTTTPTASLASCAATPRGDCANATGSLLKISDNADPSKRKLLWKWSRGTAALADLGDPANDTTNYAFCVYDDGGLTIDTHIQSGGICGDKPCWKATATSRQYTDKVGNLGGITKIKIKAGVGTAQIQVKGKGSFLSNPFPLTDATAMTVQFVRNPGAVVECWQGVFPAPAIKNEGGKFIDKEP